MIISDTKMPVKIEIFTSPYCPKSNPTILFVRSVVEELKNDVEIDIVDVFKKPSKALKYGIYAVPTVAINGRSRFVGRFSKESLMDAIKKEL